MEKLIFEYKNKGVKNPNKYYLLNGDTIKIEIVNNKGEKVYCFIDKEDFDKVKEYNWKSRKDSKTYYVLNSRIGMMHRLIMDCPADMQVDHINGNGIDNRKYNLKIVSAKQNAHNLHNARSNTGVLGVVFEDSKYPRYRAVWNEDGKLKSKCFSVIKYGENAFKLACNHRKQIEETLYRKIYEG